jgi:hypothetical protein
MSAALSAAKKRRAPTSLQPEPVRGTTSNNGMNTESNSTQGLTLPQVISLIDKRLIQLELFSKNMMQKSNQPQNQESSTEPAVNKDEIVNSVLEEFQSRFDVMADEIAEMKQIVLHLQSYTMDVNKMLLNQLKNTIGDGERFTLSVEDEVTNEE